MIPYKKILSSLFVISFILSMIMTASAISIDSNDVIASISFAATEYDLVMEFKQTPAVLLEKSGYSPETIEAFKIFSFEEALLERSQLSEDELYNMGYNESQILILKSYDGSSLEDDSQMNSIFASVTGNLSGESCSKNQIAANFSWEWDHAPLMSGRFINDIVACSVSATNDEGIPCALMVDSDSSSCMIEYYRKDSKIGEACFDVLTNNSYGIPESKFPMSKSFDNKAGWAKKGTMIVSVKEVVTVNKLSSAYFIFGYGHSVLTLDPSIGTPYSGLTFGPGTDNMFYKTIGLRHDGTYDIYDGIDRSGQFMSSAQLFGIFGFLSLIAMVAAPFLLVGIIKKIKNNETPMWECLLLAAGGFCFWYWLLMVFGSLPAM